MNTNKIPDKIYIHLKDKPLEITWSEAEEANCENVEYIRKESLPKWHRTNPERGVAFGWGISKSPERGHVVFIKGYELSIDEAFERLEKEPPTDMKPVCPVRFVLPSEAEQKSCGMPKVPPKYRLEVKSNEELLRKAASDLVNAVEQYVEPQKGQEFMHRTTLLAIKNRLKEFVK